ncbi:hypothetical protein QRD02_13430 [Aequorivita sp. SDUM287046]|uniref:DUF4595 domain-containing protein n=1 Tax=Aequorivita aurantiaca TaxID=3053356 RepID=A0ABT8DKL5_9FLAO|nr:hypothetical protein [Aequorivita aurantiaca]MDN3725384.1 hypothetical protein [Aequorivita aurantiaca]
MKKTKFIFAIILLNAFLISCSSDDDSDPDPETPSGKLVKSEKIDDNTKTDYYYNADNLLTTYSGTRIDFSYTSDFSYDSEKRLTRVVFEEAGPNPFTSVVTFTYNADGRLSGYGNGPDIVAITYNGNTVTATGDFAGGPDSEVYMELNAAGQIVKYTESYQYTLFGYDANGNMVSAASFDNDDNPLTAFTLTYDDKTNPFYGQFDSIYIERFLEFFEDFDGIYVSGFEGYSFPYFKNNITSIQETGGDSLIYTYAYDADGYPTVVNEDDMGDTYSYSISYY